ncbi:hypothetical protein BZA05DRAFT_414508 [Tricharina praecox]|uniref:uncharacterized protein n=1 Tax=Tricharina praecox TaxID=43433 RepID=UPI00221F58E1|nr:uncharacterized protein BZA05DRAFT_414508 [Tricharina praecox]KAI5858743.1 hypothetical protein BZA05DRAFT_414508 [Tricharina praecox]
MTLPIPTPGSSSSLGPLPPQWQGSEESVRAWLQTKAEEERRKAEEERTRQEQYRGDTRRVELEMLRESFKYGIPPTLVPLVFLGKGASGEWAHELVAQQMGMSAQHVGQLAIQSSAHPASPAGPALRRETRSIQQMHQQSVSSQGSGHPTPPQPPPHPHQQQQLMGPPGGGVPPPPPPPHYSTYQLPSAGRPGSSQSQPPIQQAITPQGAPPRSNLPRINTGPGEPKYIQQIHPVPMGPPPGAPGPSAHQTSHHQEAAASQISFHHWVPPATQSGGGGTSSSAQAATASPQRQLDSPFTHHPAPNALSGSDYTNADNPAAQIGWRGGGGVDR